MSIHIEVYKNLISIEKKEISSDGFQIKKNKIKESKNTSSRNKLQTSVKKSYEKVDETKEHNGDSMQKKNIVKETETSKYKLRKLEKKYKFLENVCDQCILPKNNQNKTKSETLRDSINLKTRTCSVSKLLELTQEVLQVEQEVNDVLSSKTSKQYNDGNGNHLSGDDYEITDFLLKLNNIKKQLLYEFDFNLSNELINYPLQSLASRSKNNDSITNSEFEKSFSHSSRFSDEMCDADLERTIVIKSTSSRLDEDDQMINLLTEEILMDLKKSELETSFNHETDHLNENKQTNSLNFVPILSDLPNLKPPVLRNSILHREKPPASLTCKQYKRLNIDFTIHELSAIYETDSNMSNSQINISSSK